MSVQFAVITLLCSCCINVIFLEHLIKASSDSGNILLFLQFLFIAIEGFINNRKFGTEVRHVPFKDYAVLVTIFFLSSATSNMALGYRVPMPLHMIFKSGSLVANMVLGVYLLKRSYTFTKYLSVLLVSLGILICTYVTVYENSTRSSSDTTESSSFGSTTFGVILLSVSLLISARTGIYQESIALKYGKHPRETLFYNHALPLPLFLFLWPSISKNIIFFNQSELLPVPFFSNFLSTVVGPFFSFGIDLKIPILWQYVGINILAQYFCIRSVFYLATECSSLTVTLILTLRKFFSLIVSVLYFQNDFTFNHWVGAVFVFIGTMVYSDALNFWKALPKDAKSKKLTNAAKNGYTIETKKAQ